MFNRLPEKLLKLRKHFNYSQQELANLCGVDLIEYMSWENGRNFPNIKQIKRLAEIFRITMDEMMLNSAEITLYDYTVEDIDIPFVEKTMPVPVLSILDALEEETSQDELLKTLVIPVQKVEEIKEIEPIKEEDKKSVDIKDNKLKFGLIGFVSLLVVFFVMSLMNQKPEEFVWTDLELNNLNRIAASEKNMVMIKEDQTVSCFGVTDDGQCNVNDWSDIVQVSVGNTHTVGLRKDGTLIAAGLDRYGQSSVSLWEKIVDVSAGYNHTVAVTLDGKLYCTGDNQKGQCDVEGFTNVLQVSAGKDTTAILFKDGTVKVIGEMNNAEEVSSWTDVVKIANGLDQLVALKKDGTVVAVNFDTSSWEHMIDVKSYGENIVAMNTTGSVFVLGNNKYKQCDTEDWNEAVSIAMGKDYIVMLDRDNELNGKGNNQYQVFPEEIIQQTKLSMVSNIVVELKDNIYVSWNKVENATHYDVVIEGIGSYKVSDTILILPTTRFIQDTTYTITIVAQPNRSNLMSSDESISFFTYLAPMVEPTINPTESSTPIPIIIPTPTPVPTPEITPTPEVTIEPTPDEGSATIEPTETPIPTVSPESEVEPTEKPSGDEV